MLRTLDAYFENTVKQFPEKTALYFGGQSVTFGELNQMTHALASSFYARGIDRHDRVVVCVGNRLETVVTFWACLRMGVCVSVIAPDQGLDKIRFIIEDTIPKAVIARSDLAQKLSDEERFRGGSCLLCSVAKHKGEERVASVSRPACSFEDLLSSNTESSVTWLPRPISVDLASIIFTSGSTGEPKGVVMGHDNMVSACYAITTYLGLRADDMILVALPLSFDYGLYQLILAMAVGASVVLEENVLNPALLFKRIEHHRCTILPVVPSLASLLFDFYPRVRASLASVRTLTNTGAVLTRRHREILTEMFPEARLFSMYGLTECKRCTYLPPEDLAHKPDSVGKAIPDTEISIVDEHNGPCPVGQVGQLVVRGNTVMRGYWQRPELTAQRIRLHPLSGERCLYTGDFGYMDNEGYFYFMGRADETLKIRGQKVSPIEVEQAIRLFPMVKEVAIAPIILPQTGEEGFVAFVSGAFEESFEQDMAREALRQLPAHHRPWRFYHIPHFPMTSNGKIDRKRLTQMASSL